MAPVKITNQEIYDRITSVFELLNGKEDDRDDRGLVGDVADNTAFKKSMQRAFWLAFGLLLTGNCTIFYFGWKELFNK